MPSNVLLISLEPVWTDSVPAQPNIQRIQGSGRIQIELPGVDNPERVRNLLQGVAKLQFWEVAEINEFGDAIERANAFW
jgi:SecD/SecF fusion protein